MCVEVWATLRACCAVQKTILHINIVSRFQIAIGMFFYFIYIFWDLLNQGLFTLFIVLVKRNPALPYVCKSLSLSHVSVVLFERQFYIPILFQGFRLNDIFYSFHSNIWRCTKSGTFNSLHLSGKKKPCFTFSTSKFEPASHI